jgi:DivIVA domain-containing protein
MRRKKAEQQGAPAAGGGRVTPSDVQQVEFRLAFRGYNERDVDAFLDRVTEDLAWYLEEIQRQRPIAAPSAPSASADAVAAARGEADRILAEAREEAAEIVRRAEQTAGALAAGSGDARAAVAPFLHMEREFLQGLGGLVQDHAEDVKQMVLALRARAEQERAAEPLPEPVPVQPEVEAETETETEPVGAEAGAGVAATEPAPAEPASPAEIRQRLGGAEAEEASEPEPVIVEVGTEPAYSSEGAPVGDGRERSLRELFWGED